MEREARDDRRRDAGDEALGSDDEEFAALDDVGSEPAEHPQLDDV